MTEIEQQIVRLARDGVSSRDIATAVGVNRQTVYRKVKLLRERGVEVPNFTVYGKSQPRRRVPLKPDTRDLLMPHAMRRGCDVIDLAESILVRVAEDDLVAAVLDDGGCDED